MVVRATPPDSSLFPASRTRHSFFRHGSKVLALSGLCLGLTVVPVGVNDFQQTTDRLLRRPHVQDPGKAQIGLEFEVNTYTTDNQLWPSAAMDNDGDFVVVWESGDYSIPGQDGSEHGVFGQRYDSAGNPVGSEFQINTVTTGRQRFPSVAMDNDGDFVVVWQGEVSDDDYEIFGQRYNSAGSKVGSEFQVSFGFVGSQERPKIAIDADGDFVVVWEYASFEIAGQRYDNTGSTLGSNFMVNTSQGNWQRDSAVAMDADGDFVVVWHSFYQDGDGAGVYGQRYNSAGNPVGSEFQVNTYTTGHQFNPAVAMDLDGNFIVTWGSYQDGSNSGIYLQRYTSDGSMLGGECEVNTYTTDAQWAPSIAIDVDGDFIIVWESGWTPGAGQDGSEFGVFGQRFVSYDDSPLGEEFQVNITTEGYQNAASIAMDDVGNFVVAFRSPDADESGIHAVRAASLLDPIAVHAKIALHGALLPPAKRSGGALMRTDLRDATLIPVNQPYNVVPWNYNGTETLPIISSTVVDWVLVHLRATVDGPNLATQAAILHNDGLITETDLSSKIAFDEYAPGTYYIVVEHRNHLSVVSATPVLLGTDSGLYDFTTAATQAHGGDQYDAGGMFALYGGDATTDGQVAYIGAERDQLPIITELGTGNLADVAGPIYHPADMNMDGEVAYIGAERDQRVIIETLGTANLADVKSSNVP